MCQGVCWCLDSYWSGKLEQAANIIECKRLEDARRHSRGETAQMSLHASVPLTWERNGLACSTWRTRESAGSRRRSWLCWSRWRFEIGSAIARVRLLQAQRDQARIDERNRLARDLHDSISQSLFSLNLLAQGARNLVYERPDEAARALIEIQALAQESLEAMRSLIWQLRPEGLEQGLVTALTQYGARIGLDVEVDVTGGATLPRAVEEALWRIGQEALNNVKRHAGVQRVRIEFTADQEAVTLIVRDNGAGFRWRPSGADGFGGGSFGLIGMRERAQSLGGDVTVRSRPGAGTEVRAVIPLAPEGLAGVGGDKR